jgi:AhpD family alkylhydroperoxidase
MSTGHMSKAFGVFMSEAPEHAKAWMAAVRELDQASALDKKTEELIHIALLAATRLTTGLPFHVQRAKEAGASKKEVVSAILVGLPVVGNAVTQALPEALEAYGV